MFMTFSRTTLGLGLLSSAVLVGGSLFASHVNNILGNTSSFPTNREQVAVGAQFAHLSNKVNLHYAVNGRLPLIEPNQVAQKLSVENTQVARVTTHVSSDAVENRQVLVVTQPNS